MDYSKLHNCLQSPTEIKKWYDNNYYLLSLAGLWLKGGEPNTMDPALFSSSELRFLICRLSTYRDVSMSMSHAIVSQIAREIEGVFTDFAFLPPPKDTDIMKESKIPLWTGTTTKEPPKAFDVLGISNSFVLELLNLPNLLYYSDIPLFKTERMVCSDIPLIILGGASASITSILNGPVKGQGFGNNYGLVDAVIIGEGEYAIKQFLEIVKKGRKTGLSKAEILEACHGRVDGFYEPDKYEHRYKTVKIPYVTSENGKLRRLEQNGESDEVLNEIVPTNSNLPFPVRSALVQGLDEVRTLESGPVWYEKEQLGTGTIQISNGCPCFCSFCAESWERKPYRERHFPKLLDSLRAAKAWQGLNTINLASFNFNTHAELYPLIRSFFQEIANISLKSERFDLLSADKFLVDVQQMIGKTTVSCGMEGISERLRRYLHKNLSEGQIYNACEGLLSKGLRELKIFLIQTGLEEADDFMEFRKFVENLKELRGMAKCKTRIIFSLTSLYYPPNTPLQFHPCITSLKERRIAEKEIERICKSKGMEFRVSSSYEETWLMQLLAMSDRRLTPALIRSSIQDGFFYYNTVPKRILSNWRKYLQELGLSEEYYFQAKRKNHVFPWEDIDMGIAKNFLWEEYERLIHFTEREYCLGRPNVNAQCLGCGACPSAEHKKKLTSHKMSPPFLLQELKQIAEKKQDIITLGIVVNIEPDMRLIPKQFFGIAIARALMLSMPEIVPFYHAVFGHLRDFIEDTTVADFVYGINIYYLTFLSNHTVKTLLDKKALSKNIHTVQEKCRGFEVNDIALVHKESPGMNYILYRMYFPYDFTTSRVEQEVGKYLHRKYVKHTLFKKEGSSVFKVNKKNKKSNVILYARIHKVSICGTIQENVSLLIAVTKRFEINDFLLACYGLDRRREIVCTKIEAIGYYAKLVGEEKRDQCLSCSGDMNEIVLVGIPMEKQHCLVCSLERNKKL